MPTKLEIDVETTQDGYRITWHAPKFSSTFSTETDAEKAREADQRAQFTEFAICSAIRTVAERYLVSADEAARQSAKLKVKDTFDAPRPDSGPSNPS
jgi:hypothetical protein